MTAADVEVVGVVAGRDLQRAGAELGLDVVVGDDRQAPAHQRQDRRLADEVAIALVVGVHRHGGVGEHRLGAHRGHRDRALAGLELVVDVEERVGDLAILDLEVGDRRARARVPVDHVVVAVDVALLVEGDEDLGDGRDVAVVHREALLVVVRGGAQALELLDDRGAVLLAPPPHALVERLAADLLAARPLGLERLLDLGLRRDPGVVGAEDPLGAVTAHAVKADQGVLDGPVERVAHVQRARDVGRRDGDRVVLGRRALGLGMEQPRLHPAREDARLGVGGLVARTGLKLGHGGPQVYVEPGRGLRPARGRARRRRRRSGAARRGWGRAGRSWPTSADRRTRGAARLRAAARPRGTGRTPS